VLFVLIITTVSSYDITLSINNVFPILGKIYGYEKELTSEADFVGLASGGGIGDSARVVNSIAELRAIQSVILGDVVDTISYYGDNNGGGNRFTLVSLTQGAYVDNGGTVIVDDAGRVWEAEKAEYVEQWGAKGDDNSFDNYNAITTGLQKNKKVILNDYTIYYFNSTIEFSNSQSLIANNRATLRMMSDIEGVHLISFNCLLKNINIYGFGNTGGEKDGIKIGVGGNTISSTKKSNYSIIENCYIFNCSGNGITIEYGNTNKILNSRSHENFKNGVEVNYSDPDSIVDCNLNFIECDANNNLLDGVKLTKGTINSIKGAFQGNGGYGFNCNTSETNLINVYTENNVLGGVKMGISSFNSFGYFSANEIAPNDLILENSNSFLFNKRNDKVIFRGFFPLTRISKLTQSITSQKVIDSLKSVSFDLVGTSYGVNSESSVTATLPVVYNKIICNATVTSNDVINITLFNMSESQVIIPSNTVININFIN